MFHPLVRSILPLLVTAITPFATAEEDLNRMLGRQAHNSGIPVVPAPGAVKIDGDLSEWDLSGKIWSFADVETRDDFSVQTAAMWDKDALYITLIWRDQTPMQNAIDPDVNPTWGWKSDALQLRVSSDKTQWLTFWHYTQKDQNVLHIEEWPAKDTHRGERPTRVLKGENAKRDVGEGVQIAYRKSDDGLGFVQEVRLPWALLFKEVPEIKPGVAIDLGLEFIWGDPTGSRPFHRYADNLKPGNTSREFFWTNYKAWGAAELLESGNVKPRTYISQDYRIEGVMPVEFELPAKARRFTIVIDNEDGKRVRSLGGDLTPADYKVKEGEGVVTVSVPWDVRDNFGQIVPAGSYRARGLYHEGLQAAFDTYYYNPAAKPWSSADTSTGWMADHNGPFRVTTVGGKTFLAALEAEGGHALISVGKDGRKLWGEHRGARALGADERYIYAVGYANRSTGMLWRYDHEGNYHAYTLNGTLAPFDLDLATLLDPKLSVSALAVQGDNLILAMRPLNEGEPCLVVLNKETLAQTASAPLPSVVHQLVSRADGALYAVIDGGVYQLDLKGGKPKPVTLPGVERATALTLDGQGRFVVFDGGADQQIKRFSTDGKLEVAIGKKGGYPKRGRFDPLGLRDVSSLAVDADGLIWATTNSNDPRRVTAWSEDGKLVNDLIGNSQYSGTGTYLDPTKPDNAYIGSLEFRLDREKGNHQLERILWSPDKAKNEAFELWSYPHWFANPAFLEREVNGKKMRYLFNRGNRSRGGFAAVYIPKGDHYQPVAAIFNERYALGELKELAWPEHKKMTVFWNDKNRDAAVSLDECEIVPEQIHISGYWGSIPGAGMELLASGGRKETVVHKPVGFDADGAPRYAASGVETLEHRSNGDYYPVPEEKQWMILGDLGENGKGVFGVSPDLKETHWHWPSPYNNVHGSHRAPMSRPGLLIGALKFMGIAEQKPGIGRFTAMRGNLGQDYYFTTDGLLIGALFMDARLPQTPLPDSIEELKQFPLQTLTMGGEPFSGWLGTMADGRVLNTTSLLRQAASIVEIIGLDKVERFSVKAPLVVTDALRVKAEAMPLPSDSGPAQAVSYAVTRVAKPLPLQGNEADAAWKALRKTAIKSPASPFGGRFALGYDDANLYVELIADDPSPWRNTGRNVATLFKSGDAFDLQIGPGDAAKRQAPGKGDQRIVIANLDGEPTAVLMRPVDKAAPAAAGHTYRSPVMEKRFDRVEVAKTVQTSVNSEGGRWTVRAIIPFELLGLHPKAGDKLAGDIGFISSDEAGTVNTARTYWANPQTNLVNDEPSEAWFSPARWGTLEF